WNLLESWKYDACRGFAAISNQEYNINYLLLTFNPESDGISQTLEDKVKENQNRFINKVLQLLSDIKEEDDNLLSSDIKEEELSSGKSLNLKASKVFPNHQIGLNYALSDEPILLNGMKVIFDQSTPVYPVTLEPKD
ncbi:MAG: hypothetical protein F6K24_30840, partial [Okeania sp. SIO2D1]|nr:hypothetical protein [Okeania sp. SIO2D1]